MFTIHNPFYSRCLHGGEAPRCSSADSVSCIVSSAATRDIAIFREAVHAISVVTSTTAPGIITAGVTRVTRGGRAGIVHTHALYHNPCPLWSNTHCINLSGFTVRDTWDGCGPLKCVISVFRGPPSVNRAALIEPTDVFTGSCPLNGWCLIYTLINPDLIQLSLHFSACLLLTFLIFLKLKFLLFLPWLEALRFIYSNTLATNLPSRQKVMLCLLLTYLLTIINHLVGV